MAQVIEALLVTKGHPFEREPFFETIDAIESPTENTFINWTHVEHPAAEAVLTQEGVAIYDVVVFYDMPGVTFTRQNSPFAISEPTENFKNNFRTLLEQGKPMIFMHHAIASWPTWPEYADWIGGRFHFLPGELRGVKYPGSGYRFRVQQTITVEDPEHPIVQGLGESFPYCDEAYMMPVFEDEVQPLLRSDFTFTADKFRYGGVGFQQHPEGSNLVGWTKKALNSSIAYLQFGHDQVAYRNPYYRRLFANAIVWAAAQGRNLENAA
ncbi:ThuA domain-containing protein [Agarilytica rhodophyticola]|uniref:ThuA domain-containing protein n=1 Tax=Agarilytica rhodophyticola TaxID=1737490 RepID=UPI000B342F17|nr:ThuA domain-containing protein [Agarilytica rhodophyticola]